MDISSAEQTMIDNIEKNTGRKLADWIKTVQKSGLSKHSEVVDFLKNDHGFTHGFANLVAHKAKGSDAGSADSADDLITAQYKGKETLQPFYDTLIAAIQKLGADVEIAPKNVNVSIRRKKQFALIQPTTKTRLDLGINLKGIEPQGKLEKSGSFSGMVSHRVRIEQATDIDKDVINWLKQAYEQAG